MKRCPACGLVKPLTQFHRNRLRPDGVQSICKVCRAEMDHERYEAKVGRSVERQPQRSRSGLRAWLTSLKIDQPCADCGKVFLPQVMQWDHRPGFEKLGELSGFWGRSRDEILAELAKCDLVCTNCHTIRTFSRNGWGAGWIREDAGMYDLWVCAA